MRVSGTVTPSFTFLGVLLFVFVVIGVLLWSNRPDATGRERVEWGYHQYLSYCAQQNLPMRTFDLNGANTGGRTPLCYDATGVVNRKITGRCWGLPTLTITDGRNGDVIEYTHPSCEEEDK
jgi:hypothetical protein